MRGEDGQLDREIAAIDALLRERLGLRGEDVAVTLARARRRVPWRLRRSVRELAAAAPLMAHPRLRLTLDHAGLRHAARALRAHLERIDPADRRRGWWLGMLAGMAFNLLLAAALLLVVLRWRGLV